MERQHKWKDNLTRVTSGNSRVAELVIRITYILKFVQVGTSNSDEETANLYNTVDKILEKQTHYTIIIMMGDVNAKVGGKQIHKKGRQDASAWASEMKEEIL